MTDNEFTLELDKAMDSLEELSQSIKDLPDPLNYYKGNVTELVQEAIKDLGNLKKDMDDLEAKILQPLNRARRRASEKKIQKLANKFESKSQERATSRTVSQK